MSHIVLKKLTIGILSLLLSIVARAQLTTEPFSYNTDLTPSVESWKMTQHGSLKPSLYTGTMTYSLSLYTYSDEDFTLPISLEYSYSGYRPAVHSGIVGLGWRLSCGGVITREVRGMPDESVATGGETVRPGYWRTASDVLPNLGDYIVTSGKIRAQSRIEPYPADPYHIDIFTDEPAYEKKSSGERYDINPDLFHFSFNGHSGEFMMGGDGKIHVFNTSSPHGEYAVEVSSDTAQDQGVQTPEIRISTGDGCRYIFGGTRSSLEYSVSQAEGNNTVVSAWRLRRIEAPNGFIMEFVYADVFQRDVAMLKSYTPTFDGASFTDYSYSTPALRTTGQSSYYPFLKAILVDADTLVRFSYAANAVDENAESMFDTRNHIQDCINHGLTSVPTSHLSSMIVTNHDGMTVEDVRLTHGALKGGNTFRLLLDEVSTLSSGVFRFKYHDAAYALPFNDTEDVDHWGYWNGIHTLNLLDNIDYSNARRSGDLYRQFKGSFHGRDPEFRHTLTGALRSIEYPTGGRTDISYGQNSAGQLINRPLWLSPHLIANTYGFQAGGIRVESMTTYGGTTGETVRYDYTDRARGGSSGVLMRMPRYAMMLKYAMNANARTYSITATGYTSECFQTSTGGDPEVAYGNVRETLPDGSWTDYVFSTWEDYPDDYMTDFSGCVSYDKAYESPRGPFDEDEPTMAAYRRFMLPAMTDNRSLRGKILSEMAFRADGSIASEKRYRYNKVAEMRQDMVFNTLLDYTRLEWSLTSAYLSGADESRYENGGSFTSLSSDYTYNGWGQRDYASVSSGGSSDITMLRYQHEEDGGCGQHLKGAVSAVSRLKAVGGVRHLVSVEHLQYDGRSSNPNPVSMTYWSLEAPYPLSADTCFDIPPGAATRSASLRYDDKNRLVRADLPGGAYVTYVWDASRRHIIRKTVNGTINREEYSWLDMVGLKSRSMPTGQSESYEYDSRSRLSAIRNTAGQKTATYQYHLRTEQK